MYMIIMMSSITILITNMLMILGMTISKKSFTDREKSSPFECGFDPKSSSRIPFSLRFFLITIIFLIFDVEIALILPTVLILPLSNLIIWTMTTIVFLLILLMGLYHEWNQGVLNWTE
nr:NADH dehydrogenase subunit 3 [Cerodontha fulvipes]